MTALADDTRDVINDDDDRHTGDENERLSDSSRPADVLAPVSLAQRAPVGPIASRTWNVYLRLGLLHRGYENLLEQKSQCIRSQIAHSTSTKRIGLSDQRVGGFLRESSEEVVSFPYPATFISALKAHSQARPYAQTQRITVHAEEGGLANAGRDAVTRPNSAAQEGHQRQVMPDAGRPRGSTQEMQAQWKWGFEGSVFGITRTTVVEFETHVQPIYVVVGIFPRGLENPRELVVFVDKPEQLFWRLRLAAFRLRGLRSSCFSLRHVKGFRLFKVRTPGNDIVSYLTVVIVRSRERNSSSRRSRWQWGSGPSASTAYLQELVYSELYHSGLGELDSPDAQ
jgi:hypothetical protein